MDRSLALFGGEPFFRRHGMFPSFLDWPLDEFSRDFPRPLARQNSWDTNLDRLREKFFSSLTSDIKEDSRNWNLCMDVSGFKPEELTVKLTGHDIHLSGKHETRSEDGKHQKMMSFKRHYTLPESVQLETVRSKLTPDGVLLVSATKTLPVGAKGETTIPIEFTKPAAMEQ